MSLESFLVARLTSTAALVDLVTAWDPTGTDGLFRSAIFQNVAPSDADPGWQNGSQYPRLTFQLARSMSTEQVLQGILHVQVWTRDSQVAALRQVQNALMDTLNGLPLLTDEGLVEFAFQTSTPFQQQAGQDVKVVGVDLAFTFSAYVTQTTYAPDPVAALNTFVASKMDPHIQVFPTPATATDATPLLYWRLVGDDVPARDRFNWGEWHTATLRGHVLCPGAYARLNWATLLARALASVPNRRVVMDDGSPLRMVRVRTELQASPMSQGQVVVEAKYGVLSTAPVLTFENPPIDPVTGTSGSGSGSGGTTAGGSAPPPPLTPPGIVPPVFTPQRPFVSDIDTGELLSRLHVQILTPASGLALDVTASNSGPVVTVTPPA